MNPGGHSVTRRGREQVGARTIQKGWQVVRGSLELVEMPVSYRSIDLIDAKARSPSYFISGGALVCNRGTAQHQTQSCSLGSPIHALCWRWSGCQALLALSHPSGAAARGEPPFFPDRWFPCELRHCTRSRGQQGHCRHSSQQLPVSLPACWDMGRSTQPPASAWVRNTNAEKHILKTNRLRSSKPFCQCKSLMILHLDTSLDATAMMIQREPSGL